MPQTANMICIRLPTKQLWQISVFDSSGMQWLVKRREQCCSFGSWEPHLILVCVGFILMGQSQNKWSCFLLPSTRWPGQIIKGYQDSLLFKKTELPDKSCEFLPYNHTCSYPCIPHFLILLLSRSACRNSYTMMTEAQRWPNQLYLFQFGRDSSSYTWLHYIKH